jgi:hypothetical protein
MFVRLVGSLGFVAAAWFGAIVLAVAMTAAALLTTVLLRPSIEIEGFSVHGRRQSARIRRLGDLDSALAGLLAAPAMVESRPSPAEVAVRQITLGGESADDEESIVAALVKLGETGSPSTVQSLLLAHFQAQRTLSPRLSDVAERAAERIRERGRLAELGGLALGDVDGSAGRIAIEPGAGALSNPERKK